jgi:hypothetical protein
MKNTILIILTAVVALACFAQDEVDEKPMRAALIRWHDFYYIERHKCLTNNPAMGLALTENLEMQANTRSMQLDYFDRKVCRQFAAITNAETGTNFVKQVNEWVTKPLPTHP